MAIAGVCLRWVTVDTMTHPTCSAETPACARALPAAAIDISATVSSSLAQRRVLMPERDWIHSSDESMRSISSELGTTRTGR